ncbi:hypothetical protein ASD68_03540 [Rhodanobacter sp. Root627]|uniref:hypothetical protein n=1 Tax=Rhodanobacter sp. Root627 TaxID=1736572 RepID=UPI0006F53644|nr:hypothetical protein [Rhodanobacter sp. Root627]KRA35487.1 hypothetical protein ASD68_03540 [Rhodanobacter sp. Root627]
MKTDFAAQCRFFTGEDACRIALKAYYAAARDLDPPPGEPWEVDGVPYATASDFADAFNDQMRARLALLALDRLGEFVAPSHLWDPVVLAGRIEPEKMAPIISKLETDNRKDDADFSGQKMHGLPPDDNAVHNQVSSRVESNG